MPSRQARREKASQFVEVTAVHENIQWDFVRLLDALTSDPIISQSELMREFLRCEELTQLMPLTHSNLGHVFCCTPQLIQLF